MAALLNPPSLPTVQPVPPPPTITSPAVQESAAQETKKRALAQGRASTYLTNPKDQTMASPSRQAYLGAA